MSDLKATIAKNISTLRVSNNMTQLELAQILNYSDKAISKWERGESLPDITAIIKMSEIFGVTVDDIVKSENITVPSADITEPKKYNFKIIKSIVDVFIWLVAIFMFVISIIIKGKIVDYAWLYFMYTLPIDLLVSLILNSIWFDKRKNYYIVSAFVWSVLAAVFASFVFFTHNPIRILPIFLLGVVGQVIIILWSFIKPRTKKGHKVEDNEVD